MGQTIRQISRPHAGVPVLFARNNAFSPFVAFLDDIGAPTDRWILEAHMPVAQRNDPEGLVPLSAGYRFLELAAHRGGLRDLGVVTALRTSTYELGAFGAALRGGSSVYEYLQLGTRLVTTLSSGGTKFWLRREGDQLRVRQHLAGPDGLGTQIADVFTLVVTITMLQRLIGPDWLPGELRLRAGVERLLGDWQVPRSVALVTQQPTTSFTLPCSQLSRPVPVSCAQTARNHNTAVQAAPLMPMNFLDSMQQLVHSLVAAECTDIRSTAEAAGLSLRTLQRQLAQHGTSYRSLVNAAKLRLAHQRLTDSAMRITDIAADLGYTDASNFARAFQRQTGLAPLAYRLAHRQD